MRSCATKQDARSRVDPELFKEIYKISIAPRLPPDEQLSTSTFTTFSRTSLLNVELSTFQARIPQSLLGDDDPLTHDADEVAHRAADVEPKPDRARVRRRRGRFQRRDDAREAHRNIPAPLHRAPPVRRVDRRLAARAQSREPLDRRLQPVLHHRGHHRHALLRGASRASAPLLHGRLRLSHRIHVRIECQCSRIASCTSNYEPNLEAEIYSVHVYLRVHCARMRVG